MDGSLYWFSSECVGWFVLVVCSSGLFYWLDPVILLCLPRLRPAPDLPPADARVAELRVEGGRTWASGPEAMVAGV